LKYRGKNLTWKKKKTKKLFKFFPGKKIFGKILVQTWNASPEPRAKIFHYYSVRREMP